MVHIIDGKKIAQEIRNEIAQAVKKLKDQKGIVPGLAAVLVGDNPASQVYVRTKRKACEEAGIYSEEHRLSAIVTEKELLKRIDDLNANPKIHGILVQLPLPSSISEKIILERVNPRKDVDGFHPLNLGKLFAGEPIFEPCTPLGIIRLLEHEKVAIQGKEAVIVGRSTIVGKPVAAMLLQRHATVTICHSRTQDLPSVTRRADILVVAIGKASLVKGNWIKSGATVIDVGINRLEDKTLTGDVEFETAKERAGAITPVPGGVGPMTVAMLLHNTLKAAQYP
ncbi:MAG: bifunctional methylenetetrahydrofolate dehydrogenase/methenyltetrahydrofolate cyclohydrolase FolD [Deltaproteobacteria bacterium]|nr:bifunctional methylenetetrahydrofolate dehydrogenase/methenyltetrahydrofolate cyclohydrolase FolD [Deltaproteobacteria bacterium]